MNIVPAGWGGGMHWQQAQSRGSIPIMEYCKPVPGLDDECLHSPDEKDDLGHSDRGQKSRACMPMALSER